MPSKIRYDTSLTPTAKLVYSEIYVLTKNKGYCFATNRYLSEQLNLSISTITRTIRQLEKLNYLNVSYQNNNKHGKRYIYLTKEVSHLCISRLSIHEQHNSKEIIINKKRKAFGKCNNVYLNDDEYKKILTFCGEQETYILINDLSYYIKSTGRKYKDHYSTLLSWYRKKLSQRPKIKPNWYYQSEEDDEEI